MKDRHAVLLEVVAIAGTLTFCGCEKAAPTEPNRSFAEARPAAARASLDAASHWIGTITFHAVDGGSRALSCAGSAAVSVVLSQDGTLLTGSFREDCPGELQIRGVVNGTGLSGSLDAGNGSSLGYISGTVTSSRIAFKTLTRLGQDQGYKGQPAFVSSEVELHHQYAEREAPVLAGGNPSAHDIVVRR